MHFSRRTYNKQTKTKIGLLLPTTIDRNFVGVFSKTCQYCQAKFNCCEETTKKVFTLCCKLGKIVLASTGETPEYLRYLLENNDEDCQHFRDHIRGYNSALSFTSLGVKLDQNLLNQRLGAYCFRIQGNLYHLMGSMMSLTNETPKFTQLYVIDTANEIDNRMIHTPNLKKHVLKNLQEMLHQENLFVKFYKNAFDAAVAAPELSIRIKAQSGKDRRQYNLPTNNEIAFLLPGEIQEDRDIIIKKQCGGLQRISTSNACYDPLHYVLLFPKGEFGWELNMKKTDNTSLTCKDYYCHKIMIRDNNKSLLKSGKLLQEFIVDSYVKVEQAKVYFIKTHQKEIRAESYQGAMDALINDAPRIGKNVILPSSFLGSPRHMHQLYQDAMAIVREKGKPSYFITFTCNPQWKEITDNLYNHQKPCDRPDIVSRIFNIKANQLLNDLTKNQIFGKVSAYVYVIEFQKRGLPHMHLLVIMADIDKPKTLDTFDKVVCAEIPDRNNDPLLYETVTKCLFHGPCGAVNPTSPCMIKNKCSKKIPKQFIERTALKTNGYVLYRRRNNGIYFEKQSFKMDNQWVVPYNPFLAKKYNAHINVEICSSTSAVKYLYKYIYKGHDKAIAAFSTKILQIQEMKLPNL